MSTIDKGTRVEIVAGKDAGVVGEVFWWGKSKFGDGMRAGVKGDDGETYWVDAEELEVESAKTEPPLPPLEPGPFVPAPPRDGSHTQADGDSGLEWSGDYVDGLKHGVWEARDADGNLVQKSEWKRGRKHGVHQEFLPDGQQVIEGQYRHHKPAGEWKEFYENGALKESYSYDAEGQRHGPYVWNFDDGSPRARGAFWHGKRHGEWEWLNGDEYERSLRGYHRGQKHGEAVRWFTDGQLEYRVPYHFGARHGDHERNHPDGSPAFRGTWRYGFGVGEHRTWDESGAETITRYIDGQPAELDESGEARVLFDVKRASSKVRKAKDSYAKTRALDDFVDFGSRPSAVFHMWNSGEYDAPGDPEIWETLGRARGLFGGEEVVRFLKDASDEGRGEHLPGWTSYLDRLVVDVYARDPEPIDAAQDSFPEWIQRGVALVQARFGQDVGDTLHASLEELVHKHVHNYGIADSIVWPVEGCLENVRLFEDSRKAPTDYFMKFIEFFGGMDAWADALQAEVHALLEDDSDIRFPTFRPVVERADEDLLVRLCESISLSGTTQDVLRDALLEWRDDDGETLTRVALAVDDTGLRKWPLTSVAVLKLTEEGHEIPEELVDAFVLGVESPTYSSSWHTGTLREIPDEFKGDPHYTADAIPMQRGSGVPRVSMVHEALACLSDGQVRRIVERHLDSERDALKVVPYLYRVDDADLWQTVIELVEAHNYGARPENTWGFGEIGLPVMPLLEAALERARSSQKKSFEFAWRQAIICALTRAALDGAEIPDEYDRLISFDLVERDYDYDHIRPYLDRLFYLLPTERAQPIIASGLSSDDWGRALRMVSLHPTESLVTQAFEKVRQRESTMESREQQAFEHMLKALANPADWVRWFLKSGAGAGCKSALSNAVGWKTLEAIESELDEPVEELDQIDKLVNLAQEVGGGERMYFLRRLDEHKSEDLNVIGGVAPGVDAQRWPTFDDEPMAHLYTLDLETVPELAEQMSARTVSVFCHSPDLNEAWEPGTSQSAVLFTTEAQLAEAATPPEGIDDRPEARFEVVGIDVDLSHEKLRKEVYRAGARVLGPPMWLQDEAHFGNFLMQFDERFVHMNLGDMGIMYVFDDTAFWQCH